MSGKVLFNGASPVTQTVESVEALAAYLKKPIEGGVLDLGAVKLVKSNKGNAFYCVTAKACSCPSATYRPGQTCKHQRKHFGLRDEPLPETTGGLMERGRFKPVMPEDERAVA